MLVLSRKEGQAIRIGDHITLRIIKTQGGSVKVGIEAPSNVRILRGELDVWNEPLHVDHQQTIPLFQ